jgi:hypothetical protein
VWQYSKKSLEKVYPCVFYSSLFLFFFILLSLSNQRLCPFRNVFGVLLAHHQVKKRTVTPIGMTARFCFLFVFNLQVTLQCLDVCLERLVAFYGNATDGAGTLALEGFLNLDVARCREFVNLHAQVARRSSRLLLDVGELGLVDTDKQRHHSQSQLSVQEWI